MKSRFALVAMMLIAAAPLAAQGGGGGGGRRGGGRGGITNVDAMTTLLSLTADQKTKFQTALDAYNKIAQPLQQYAMAQRQAGATQSPDSTAKSTAARTQFQKDVDAFLTPDQKTKFDSAATAAPTGRRGGGGGK